MTKCYKILTFFCADWRFLHKIFDKYRVFAYQTYIFPRNNAVVRPAEKTEKLGSSVYDERRYARAFHVYLQIVDEAYPTTVAGVYHFLFSQLIESARHLITPCFNTMHHTR